MQLTVTVVTSPATTVPVAPLTAHRWGGPPGWVLTATSNGFPLDTFFENVAVTGPPAAAVTAQIVASVVRQDEAVSDETGDGHGDRIVVRGARNLTSVTSADAVPLPPVITHVCAGPVVGSSPSRRTWRPRRPSSERRSSHSPSKSRRVAVVLEDEPAALEARHGSADRERGDRPCLGRVRIGPRGVDSAPSNTRKCSDENGKRS